MDQRYKDIVNFVDYATRRSFPFALRKTGDAAEAGRKFVEMIKQVRREFYGDADSNEWVSGRRGGRARGQRRRYCRPGLGEQPEYQPHHRELE